MSSRAQPFVLGTILVVAGTAIAAPPSKQALRTAWEAQWARISDLEVVCTLTNQSPGGALPTGMIRALSWTLRWDGRRYWWREAQPGSTLAAAVSIDTQTRERRLLYYFDDGSPRGEIRTLAGQYLGATLWLVEMLRPPEGHPATDSLSDLLAAPDSVTSLRPATELVDDRQAAVLDVFGAAGSDAEGQVVRTIWLDVERNAVPLKQQWYGLDGSVRFTTYLRGYVEAAEGVWLPTRIESLDGFRHRGVTRVLRVAVDSDGRPQIRINTGLTADDCTVQFPPGTVVVNADTGSSYVAVADELPAQELLFRLYAAGAGDARRFNQDVPVGWWLALAAAVASGGLFGLHSVRNPRRAG